MKVYVTKLRRSGTKFHKSPDCIRAKREGKSPEDWLHVSLEDIHVPKPCRECFPEAPHVRPDYLACDQGCKKPCIHAGGVMVRMMRRNHRHQVEFVWPHQAAWYERVDFDVANPV